MTTCTQYRHCLAIGILLVLLAVGPLVAGAQSMEETMLEQIARLETTLQQLKRGYEIVRQGLSTISAIKQGQFDLHNIFFSSLMHVNPSIQQYSKIADILAMQGQILLGCRTTLPQYVSSGMFNARDLGYLSAVYTNLKELTSKDVDELLDLVSNDFWQMSDDQRMRRINQLYDKVEEKYVFLQAFTNRTREEGRWRAQQQLNLQNLSKLINP
ncbi:MAG TPA: hypothetical protein VHE34_21125 [Puia sp.]|uniref:hypothetical protein n=1 Tax=Puia sp. TaxID=2045100 RepID=UPI002BCA2ECE|nr:hypothetical protein [Puia sp.]HVU97746.1 hypothetical protein [Puia sp.]